MSLPDALKLAVDSLASDPNGGVARTLTPDQLEVAVLDRSRWQQRKFKRLLSGQLSRLLEGDATAASDDEEEPPATTATAPEGE
jgi:proteasome alpha subunit